MATLTVTIASGQNPRAVLERLAKQMRSLAYDVSNGVSGGATVLTIDNNPGGNAVVSIQVTSGPHSSSKKGTS